MEGEKKRSVCCGEVGQEGETPILCFSGWSCPWGEILSHTHNTAAGRGERLGMCVWYLFYIHTRDEHITKFSFKISKSSVYCT